MYIENIYIYKNNNNNNINNNNKHYAYVSQYLMDGWLKCVFFVFCLCMCFSLAQLSSTLLLAATFSAGRLLLKFQM